MSVNDKKCKHEWPEEKIIKEAEKEPDRIKFWLPYCDNYLEACIAVLDNPPNFDKCFKNEFPDPEKYKKINL